MTSPSLSPRPDTCPPFVHLHVHSHYSFFDGTLSPEDVVALARHHGCPAVALTDTNSFSGAVLFYKAAREAGIKPILGVEITQLLPAERALLRARPVVEHWSGTDEDPDDISDSAEHNDCAPQAPPPSRQPSHSPSFWHGDLRRRAVLLARSFAGYSEISRLTTRRALDPDFDLFTEVLNLSPEVVVLTDSTEVLEAVALAGRPDGLSYAFLVPSRRRRKHNRSVYERAQRLGIPLTVGGDVRMAAPGDASLHDLLQAMRRLITIHQLAEADRIDPAQHFQSPDAVRAFFGLDRPPADDSVRDLHHDLAQAVANTARIAELCHCELPLGQWKFPRFDGITDPPSACLRRLVDAGLAERYRDPVPDNARRRAEYELSVIEQLHFTDYFLLVHRIVSECRSRGFHTLGRGSAANSIVTYALGISHICPIQHDLYFERFLNPERNSPPDIDIDLSWKERDTILAWCFDFFGPERVALISTVQTLRQRQAIREVAKAHGISESEVNRFTRLQETGFRVEEERDGSVRPTRHGRTTHNLAESEPWRTILAQAARLAGFPRHLSVHCGGIVIAPEPVTDYVPLSRSAKGYAITQMDMVGVEDLGLIKIDLLGNRSLGVLEDTIRMAQNRAPLRPAETAESAESGPARMDGEVFAREAVRMKLAGTRRGTSVALAGVMQAFTGGDEPESRRKKDTRTVREQVFDFQKVTNDSGTRALIDSGRTMGCFYVESPGMRALFERLRCRTFTEVVAASSIIRPGVAESGMMQEYIVRHQHALEGRAQGAFLEQEMNRAGMPGSRSGTRVAMVLDMAYVGEPKRERDLRSPSTLLPPSEASRRLAEGLMPINAHARARPLPGGASVGSRRAPAAPPSELMLRILPETHGVMVYQEDVLRVAHRVAGLTLGEADVLRRIMSGKGSSQEVMERLEGRFFNGARTNGVSDEDALEIWRQMSSFAGYSFCKGHSAAFAALSYQVTWLKAHYPAEFFAALISNGGGFYGPGAYAQEARRWGMEVLPPCVNESEEECTGLTLESVPEIFRGLGWVRIGLAFVMGTCRESRRRILEERRARGRFRSVSDFVERCGLGLEESRALAKAGALDDVARQGGDTRPVTALRPALLLELSCLLRQREIADGGFLPLGFSLWKAEAKGWDTPDTLTLAEICRMEVEHLGFMLSGHPMDFFAVPGDVVPAKEIRAHAGKRVRMAGWMIAAKLLAAKTNGRLMKMLTLEDRTDTFEAILFPRVYARYASRALSNGPFLVEGKVDVSLGSPTLNVERVA